VIPDRARGWTPSDGYAVKGAPTISVLRGRVVMMSVLRGRVVMEDGEVVGEKGYGEYVRRW